MGTKSKKVKLSRANMKEKKSIRNESDEDRAIRFSKKVNAIFRKDRTKYKKFMKVCKLFLEDFRTVEEVYEEVQVLFKDHIELLKEFEYFVPK